MSDIKKFRDLAEQRIRFEWGRNAAVRVGPRLYRALLAEELLYALAAQDEHVSDAKVRELVNEFYSLTRAHPGEEAQ